MRPAELTALNVASARLALIDPAITLPIDSTRKAPISAELPPVALFTTRLLLIVVVPRKKICERSVVAAPIVMVPVPKMPLVTAPGEPAPIVPLPNQRVKVDPLPLPKIVPPE